MLREWAYGAPFPAAQRSDRAKLLRPWLDRYKNYPPQAAPSATPPTGGSDSKSYLGNNLVGNYS